MFDLSSDFFRQTSIYLYFSVCGLVLRLYSNRQIDNIPWTFFDRRAGGCMYVPDP